MTDVTNSVKKVVKATQNMPQKKVNDWERFDRNLKRMTIASFIFAVFAFFLKENGSASRELVWYHPQTKTNLDNMQVAIDYFHNTEGIVYEYSEKGTKMQKLGMDYEEEWRQFKTLLEKKLMDLRIYRDVLKNSTNANKYKYTLRYKDVVYGSFAELIKRASIVKKKEDKFMAYACDYEMGDFERINKHNDLYRKMLDSVTELYPKKVRLQGLNESTWNPDEFNIESVEKIHKLVLEYYEAEASYASEMLENTWLVKRLPTLEVVFNPWLWGFYRNEKYMKLRKEVIPHALDYFENQLGNYLPWVHQNLEQLASWRKPIDGLKLCLVTNMNAWGLVLYPMKLHEMSNLLKEIKYLAGDRVEIPGVRIHIKFLNREGLWRQFVTI